MKELMDGKRRVAFQLIARGKRLRAIVRLVIASAIALGGYVIWLFVFAAMYQRDFVALMHCQEWPFT